ncbi:MAG: 4'-phosphopantetheinyl transferase superfamily protein [Nocardioidaceae bacterium]
MTAVVRFAPVTGDEDAGLLGATERERCARLHDPRDRAAFVAAHVLVRECAGALLGFSPDSVRIEQHCPRCSGPHGRPSVVGHSGVHASLSHTRTHVAAVTAWSPCGIDVEPLRPVRPPDSALTPREREQLAMQTDPATAFLRLWVRKEALIKAGLGSLDALDELDADAHQERLNDWSGADAVGAWVVL